MSTVSIALRAAVGSALALAAVGTFASVAPVHMTRASSTVGYVDGSQFEQRGDMFKSTRSAAEVRAEAAAANRGASAFIDGSAYEWRSAMFTSAVSREQVRAQAADAAKVASMALLVGGGR